MGLSQIMEKHFALLVGIVLLQLVLCCSGADVKVKNEKTFFLLSIVYCFWILI